MCEIAECYEVDPRKARKAYRCVACLGAIPAGEIYEYHHGIFEGSPFDFRVCVDCGNMVREINAEQDNSEDMIAVQELAECMFERSDRKLKRFVENKIKRGAEVKPWMLERIKGIE